MYPTAKGWTAWQRLASIVAIILASNADAGPTTVSVADAVAAPGAGPVQMQFLLSRSGDLGYGAVVRYHTVDGTAVAGTDYVAASGAVTIEAASDHAIVPVTLNASTGASEDRTFQLVVDDVVGVAVAPAYSTALISAIGDGARAPVSADVNGDGRPDVLALSLSQDTMTVLLNETPPGAGVAVYAEPHAFATGDAPRTLVVADVNNDGKPDALIANVFDNTMSVLLNTTAPGAATPTFAAQQTFVVGDFGGRSIAVADFDGDGRMDVAATHDPSGPPSGVAVLLNTTVPGSSLVAFTPAQDFPAGVSSWDLAAADLNGDGRPDLVVGDLNADQAWVLLNTTTPGAASASFTASQAMPTGAEPRGIVAADIDGDGRRDLVVADSQDDAVAVLRNTTLPGSMTASFAAPDTFTVPARPEHLVVADLNGDGRLDIGVTDTISFASTLLFNTTPPGSAHYDFGTSSIIPVAGFPAGIATSDINGDGIADILVCDEIDGTMLTLLGGSVSDRAIPAFGERHDFEAGPQPMHVAVADFNGDGMADLVVNNVLDSSVSVLLNATPPSATEPAFSPRQVLATGGQPVQPVAPDLNGDGRPDVAVVNTLDGSVSVLMNTTAAGASAASFAAAQAFDVEGGTMPSIAVADANRDGKMDLFVATGGGVRVLVNTTGAGAGTASFDSTLAQLAIFPDFVTTADINLDGAPDIVTTYMVSDSVSVALNTTPIGAGMPTFAASQDITVGNDPSSIAVADVNGDGKPDLLVALRAAGAVLPLLNITTPGAASAAFLVGAPIPAGLHTYADHAVDINGDGRPDVVASDSYGSGATLLMNATPAGSSPPQFVPLSIATQAYPTTATTSDVNGDGNPDLIAVAQGNAQVSVLLNTQFRTSVAGSPATGTIVGDGVFADGFD